MDFNGSLIVRCRGKDFRLARGNRGIAFNQLGEHTTQSFNAEAQRRNVQQQDIGLFTGQDSGLNRRANRHHLVRIHTLVGFLAEEGLNDFLHLGNSRRTSDQDHFVNLLSVKRRIFQGLFERRCQPLENRIDQLLKTSACQLHHQVLGARLIGSDEWQIDFSFHRRRKFNLCFLGSFLQALQGHLVLR